MGTGTIDDVVANDPAISRLEKGFNEFEQIGVDLQPHLKGFLGENADSALAEKVVQALYEPAEKGGAPIVAQVLAKYGINSKDYETTIAQYGIPREELKKAITQSKTGKLDAAVIQQIGATIASRYFGKIIEAEPTRLANLADKIGISKVVGIVRDGIKKLYGEAAVKAEKLRLDAIKTSADLREYLGGFYNAALNRYQTAGVR